MSDLPALRALLDAPEPLRWLFTGDSITHGAVHTNGERDYVQLFEERVRWELRRTRDHVVRTAISGRTVDDLRADAEWSLAQYRADVVFLMFGLNDAATTHPDPERFTRDLVSVVELARASGARAVVLQTPNRMLATETPARRTNLPGYAEAVRRAASESGAALVDHHADWSAAERDGTIEYWIDHGCHPNAAGHRVLHRSIALRLGTWDSGSPTGRFFIPALESLPPAGPEPGLTE